MHGPEVSQVSLSTIHDASIEDATSPHERQRSSSTSADALPAISLTLSQAPLANSIAPTENASPVYIRGWRLWTIITTLGHGSQRLELLTMLISLRQAPSRHLPGHAGSLHRVNLSRCHCQRLARIGQKQLDHNRIFDSFHR